MAETGTLKYRVVEGWEQLPAGFEHRDVAGVAVDLEDRVFLICRGDHPILVYTDGGKFLKSWGEGEFTYRTHGITIDSATLINHLAYLSSAAMAGRQTVRNNAMILFFIFLLQTLHQFGPRKKATL